MAYLSCSPIDVQLRPLPERPKRSIYEPTTKISVEPTLAGIPYFMPNTRIIVTQWDAWRDHAFNNLSPLAITSSDAPMSAAIAAQRLAYPANVRITNSALMASENPMF